MSVVKIFAFLELKQKSTFFKDLYLFVPCVYRQSITMNMVKIKGWKL